MGPCRSFGGNLSFLASLGIAEILGFFELSVYTEVIYPQSFHNTSNYAFTASIEEVMRFYNLGDKTFETDFNIWRKCDSPGGVIVRRLNG